MSKVIIIKSLPHRITLLLAVCTHFPCRHTVQRLVLLHIFIQRHKKNRLTYVLVVSKSVCCIMLTHIYKVLLPCRRNIQFTSNYSINICSYCSFLQNLWEEICEVCPIKDAFRFNCGAILYPYIILKVQWI